MPDPDWLKVLRVFYEENISHEADPSGKAPSWVVEHEKLNDIDVQQEISKLHSSGLLEVNEEYIPEFDSTSLFASISQKGFEVVYEHDF